MVFWGCLTLFTIQISAGEMMRQRPMVRMMESGAEKDCKVKILAIVNLPLAIN